MSADLRLGFRDWVGLTNAVDSSMEDWLAPAEDWLATMEGRYAALEDWFAGLEDRCAGWLRIGFLEDWFAPMEDRCAGRARRAPHRGLARGTVRGLNMVEREGRSYGFHEFGGRDSMSGPANFRETTRRELVLHIVSRNRF